MGCGVKQPPGAPYMGRSQNPRFPRSLLVGSARRHSMEPWLGFHAAVARGKMSLNNVARGGARGEKHARCIDFVVSSRSIAITRFRAALRGQADARCRKPRG